MPLFIDSQLSGYTHSVLSLITPAIPFDIAPKEPLQVGVKGEHQDGTLNQSVTPNGAGGASATPSPVAGTENVIYFNRASHSNSTAGESGWLACLWSAGGGGWFREAALARVGRACSIAWLWGMRLQSSIQGLSLSGLWHGVIRGLSSSLPLCFPLFAPPDERGQPIECYSQCHAHACMNTRADSCTYTRSHRRTWAHGVTATTSLLISSASSPLPPPLLSSMTSQPHKATHEDLAVTYPGVPTLPDVNRSSYRIRRAWRASCIHWRLFPAATRQHHSPGTAFRQ